MKVITAIENYQRAENEISVFLAGGITNCWDWQQAVIDELSKFDNTDNLVVYNPRRKEFPIWDSNAAQEQIEWEFKYLHEVDIFSMYFTAGESTQPICMYELGVHLTRYKIDAKPLAVIVSVENGYVRSRDVEIQTKLVVPTRPAILDMDADAKSHADRIYRNYKLLIEMSSEASDVASVA